jgi:iron(III) transport system substrate-binding protein
MKRLGILALALLVAALVTGGASAQAPIEGELTLITPVSKFIHDAALKAFADYAKEKWGATVKVNAIPAGTPVAYGRIVEWKGKPEADIFWGGESALFEKLAEQKLLQKVEISKEAWDSIPATIGKPNPAQGQGRLLGRDRAGAVRHRLSPEKVPAARHSGPQGVG